MNNDLLKEYYDGLRRKLIDLENLTEASEGSEHIQLKGKAKGVKLAIQDCENYTEMSRDERHS